MADESTNNNKKKFNNVKIVATIVALIVIGGGLIGQWYTQEAAVAELRKDVTKVEEVFVDYKEKTDDRILNMKLDITSSTSDIATIKEDIGEIKVDVKTLLKGRE